MYFLFSEGGLNVGEFSTEFSFGDHTSGDADSDNPDQTSSCKFKLYNKLNHSKNIYLLLFLKFFSDTIATITISITSLSLLLVIILYKTFDLVYFAFEYLQI